MTADTGGRGRPAGIRIVFDEPLLRADLARLDEQAHGAIAELRFRLDRYGMPNSTLRPLELKAAPAGELLYEALLPLGAGESAARWSVVFRMRTPPGEVELTHIAFGPRASTASRPSAYELAARRLAP